MKTLCILVVSYLQLTLFILKGFPQSPPAKDSDELKTIATTEINVTQRKLLIAEDDLVAQSIMSNFIDMNIVHDKQGFTWIETNKNSIYRYNGRSLKEFQMAFSSRNYKNILFVSRNGTLWVGRTYNRDNVWRLSVNQFNRQTEKFKSFTIPLDLALKESSGLNSNHTKIIALNEDESGNLWIILNIGIYLLDLKTGTYTPLSLPTASNTDKQENPFIQVAIKEIGGEIWIGTNHGLYRYKGKKFTHYQHDPSDLSSLSNNDIIGLHLDRAGTLWIEPNIYWTDTTDKDQRLNIFLPVRENFRRVASQPRFPQMRGWNYKTGKAIIYQYDEEVYKEFVEEIADLDSENHYMTPMEVFIYELKRFLPYLSVPFFIIIVLSFAYYRSRLKQVRLKASFDKQLAEVSMTALRAQMNPHFLFNSLNSINHFIIKNKQEEAAEYLTKFSRLIRLILTNSKSPAIPLSNELEAIRLYIQLENIRFNNRFEYNIEVVEGVDIEYFEIPPLLIQPYVENAIWHGLLHKEGKGHLKLLVYVQDPFLYVVIEDDGVGRQKAQELKSKSATKDKSMGMQITSDRVDMLNKLKQQQATVEIIDLEDQVGNATGTKVILKVPL